MNKSYNFILLLAFQLLITFNSYSQNLILNSRFDEFDVYYDNNRNIVYHPRNWFYNENKKSHPFYFSTARFLNEEIRYKIHPDGELIKQGNTLNYIGLRILPYSQSFYSKLSKSLIEAETYNLSIEIKVLGSFNCLTDLFIGFSERNPDSADVAEFSMKIPESFSFKNGLNNWTRFEMKYKATGKENFLIIGTKNAEKYIQIINSDSLRFDRRQRFDYGLEYFDLRYGIDNVSLYQVDLFKSIMDSLKVNESFILENIHFEFEKANLNERSFPTLKKLSEYLLLNESIKIEIQGHTDNVGSKEFNAALSTERAKSVRNYLIENGISGNRIRFIGFGYDKPIALNDKEDGRQLNRRVEIKIVEK